MTENGVVKKVEQGLAWVIMVKGEQCGGCTACKAFGEGNFEIVALNTRGAKPGDFVKVETNPRQVVKYSAIVFILPVVSLIMGYFIGSSSLTRLGLSSETAGILGSLGLLLITFIGIIGYDRVIRKTDQIKAQITQIL
jgi:sigma-E factor negative regulatory protein RseC